MGTHELCYLTQVVIRLFEDTQKPSEDPRRFRVEIMFSPGATATPLHMAKLYREKDPTRLDTEELQKISIDSLTSAQVEEYFAEAIREGAVHDKDDEEAEKKPADKDESREKTVTIKENLVEVSSETTPANLAEKVNSQDEGNGSTVTKEDKTEGHIDEPTIKSSDSVSNYSDENHAHRFWRSAAMLGALFGAGCMLVMLRGHRNAKLVRR